jgi:pyruvate dehydrogenase E2 component (dihydrolipoamide acetyltransferase)
VTEILDIPLPALTSTMESGVLAKWRISPGDVVTEGQVIAEIETDKSVMDMESPASGVVRELLVSPGSDAVPVGTLLLRMASNSATPRESVLPATVDASPMARRQAKNAGIDLSSLRGTGPGGRIFKKDVASRFALTQREPGGDSAVRMPSDTSCVRHKLTPMRRAIAARLSEAKRDIPHFYLTIECEMDPLLAVRSSWAVTGLPEKPSLNDFLVRAAALALVEIPEVNAQFAGEELLQFGRVDICVAVAIPGGLVTPVIRDAGGKSVADIAGEMRELAELARSSRLTPEQYSGGTFSLSNLGTHGVRQFCAVINPPQAAILAVGQARQCPIVRDGAIGIGTMMTCTLSCDHRVIDGATGARWLAAFKRLVESPARLVP